MNKNKKPNFLIFVVDQMQSFSMGCNGNKEVKTPNIDKLASNGVTFKRAYCNNPVCTPSRSTMITGLLPRQHGCLSNGRVLSQHIPNLPGVLHNHGYKTHSVGKLHYHPYVNDKMKLLAGEFSWEDKRLWDRGEITKLPKGYYGFDTHDFLGGHGRYCFGEYIKWLNEKDPTARDKYKIENSYLHVRDAWRMNIPKELHYNKWIVEKTKEYLDGVEDNDNFFLWCSFPDPHLPFASCRPYSDMYNPEKLTLPKTWNNDHDHLEHLTKVRKYLYKAPLPLDETYLREVMAQTYGMITHIDDSIGEIMKHLKDKELDKNTVIVFMSDHGEYLGSHNLVYKAAWQLEQTLRVPFIWSSPFAKNKGKERKEVVSLIDFAPTILEYAGIDEEEFCLRGLPQGEYKTLPGRSLVQAVEKNNNLEKIPALVESDEDCYLGKIYRTRTIVEDRFKLTIYPHNGGGVLVDLKNDPDEEVNLYYDKKYGNIRNNLTEKMLTKLMVTDRLERPRICSTL
ncbi:sulfatase family protein [Clostridium tarantellae]|uniref:Sulfatase-like hydrolase/transferase n=1 Tax=Clostridium tarantellae TaxID=39493 RepID=A0A6I1MLF3_9CLOT|nr:sulfatase-like hydrolase/transferase [Clostridium tarantellae]MPQ43824.1 sulfatase-like hydrolase/transferase [Clostridium tarantellae]